MPDKQDWSQCPCTIPDRECPIVTLFTNHLHTLASEWKEQCKIDKTEREKLGLGITGLDKRLSDFQLKLLLALAPIGLSFLGLIITVAIKL